MTKNEGIRLVVCVGLAVAVTYVVMAERQAKAQAALRAEADAVLRKQEKVEEKKKVTVLETSTEPVVKEVPPVTTRVVDGKTVLSMMHTPQVLAMKPCKAKLVSVNPCTGVFEIGAGQELQLGGPFTSRPIFSFLRTLEKGETYEMPGAFIEFLDKGVWKQEQEIKNYANEKF